MAVPTLQPDQDPTLWSRHVSGYEQVFEPLTNQFAEAALASLDLGPGRRCLDVAAGTGGAALMAAMMGAAVTAIDASAAMVGRIEARADAAGLDVRAGLMDAQALQLEDASFDAAFSIFGVILCQDPAAAVAEMVRVVRPGGRIVLVTWTEPQHYELVSRLLAAIAEIRGHQPAPPGLPAQLRFREEADFRALLASCGLVVERLSRVAAALEAPSARWLADRLAFAPGIATMLAAQGEHREAVVARFVSDLERDQGFGRVSLPAVAFLGVGRVDDGGAPATTSA